VVVAAADDDLRIAGVADPLATTVGLRKSKGVPATGVIAPVGISSASTGV
jgi:hypothetical protein